MLFAGNQRFREGRSQNVNFSRVRVEATVERQRPFAVVLTCCDLRLTPEVIFDQGMGDLFVVRVGGNALDPLVVGSIEMGISALGARLVLILGHDKCAAMTAALQGGVQAGSIGAITAALLPAVNGTKEFRHDRLERAIELNLRLGVAQLLRESPMVDSMKKTEDLLVMGAVYEHTSRRVRFLD